jgi:hypothetical protein
MRPQPITLTVAGSWGGLLSVLHWHSYYLGRAAISVLSVVGATKDLM